jgi:hypothetical protein
MLNKVAVVVEEPVVPHRMKGNICPLGIFLLRSFDNTFFATFQFFSINQCNLFVFKVWRFLLNRENIPVIAVPDLFNSSFAHIKLHELIPKSHEKDAFYRQLIPELNFGIKMIDALRNGVNILAVCCWFSTVTML